MTERLITLLIWTLVGTLWLALHAGLVQQAVRSRPRSRAAKWHWLALLPPFAPVIAWLRGSRVLVVLWVLVGAAYVGLRMGLT